MGDYEEVPEIEGILIVQVVPNGPAVKGGLRRGDVILKVEGTTMTRAEQLQDLIERHRIGQALRFKVRRGGQTQTFTVYPADLQDFSQ